MQHLQNANFDIGQLSFMISTLQTRLPGDLVSTLKAIMEEYAEETAVSQGSEESEDQQVLHPSIQHPNFPSEQLLHAIGRTVEVRNALLRLP